MQMSFWKLMLMTMFVANMKIIFTVGLLSNFLMNMVISWYNLWLQCAHPTNTFSQKLKIPAGLLKRTLNLWLKHHHWQLPLQEATHKQNLTEPRWNHSLIMNNIPFDFQRHFTTGELSWTVPKKHDKDIKTIFSILFQFLWHFPKAFCFMYIKEAWKPYICVFMVSFIFYSKLNVGEVRISASQHLLFVKPLLWPPSEL